VPAGAGFGGILSLYKLRTELGFKCKLIEGQDGKVALGFKRKLIGDRGVGGTWRFNQSVSVVSFGGAAPNIPRYPGAMSDSPSYLYRSVT
jgi:cation diffusion facilitator CzcD-associated flavoprotein CzcO